MKKKKRNKKSRKDGTFTLAAKRFIISCMLILSLTGLAAGIAYADGNSRKMAVGERGSTVALAHREKQLELSINEKRQRHSICHCRKSTGIIYIFCPLR